MAIPALLQPLSLPADPDATAGRSIGVLLSHGFTGSPASMRPWGEFLGSQGFGVELPRLPGHGTTWQDMNTTTWSDWYGEVSRSFDALSARCDRVVLAGLSMGGALMLQLAADRGQEVSGVILVNPAVNTTRKDVLALPIIKHVIGSFPGISNDIALEGADEHAYSRTPLKAAHSMMQAWKPLRARLGSITAPVLYFKSTQDHVVDPSSLEIITSGLGSTDVSVRTLDRSFHVATLDHDAPEIFSESADFIRRVSAR